MAACFIFKI